MELKEFLSALNKEDEEHNKTVAFKDFLFSRRSMFGAFDDIFIHKMPSKTRGHLKAWYLPEKGKYLLTDGWHRIIPLLLFGKRKATFEIIGEGYTDYWAEPLKNDLFKATDTKFGGLEDLADEELLEDYLQEYRGGKYKTKR